MSRLIIKKISRKPSVGDYKNFNYLNPNTLYPLYVNSINKLRERKYRKLTVFQPSRLQASVLKCI